MSLYLPCRPEDRADYAVLTGNPDRVDLLGCYLEDVVLLGQRREFRVLRGHVGDASVLLLSSGIGAPSAAIAVEELAELGVKVVIRLGTAMAITARLGDYIVAHHALGLDGTSATYGGSLSQGVDGPEGWAPAPPALDRPPLFEADPGLVSAFVQGGGALALPIHEGTLVTCDGFYTQMARGRLERGQEALHRTWVEQGIAGVEMESAAILAAASALGMRAGAVCVATVSGMVRDRLSPTDRRRAEENLGRLMREGIRLDWMRQRAGR